MSESKGNLEVIEKDGDIWWINLKTGEISAVLIDDPVKENDNTYTDINGKIWYKTPLHEADLEGAKVVKSDWDLLKIEKIDE